MKIFNLIFCGSFHLFQCNAFVVLAFLSACDNSDAAMSDTLVNGTPVDAELSELEANTVLTTQFATPNADGKFSTTIDTIFNGSYEDQNGNGYALEISRKNTVFNAQIGVLQNTDAGDFPLTGSASMQGAYTVAEVGKSDGDFREYGEVLITNGQIMLFADFKFGTLTGESDDLIIDGKFTDKALTGNAYFEQRKADLNGQVGADRAIGVFHGSDDATAFVGGFLVER